MKKIMALGIAGLMMMGVAGCGTKPAEVVDPQVDAGTETETETEEIVDKSETLLIYSNSASNGRGEWLMEKAASEGYNVEVINIQGGDLTNRLIGEKNNSLADLVYGLNTLEYEKLKQEDLLLKYEPTWASEVDMTLGDADGYYYPIVVQPLVLISNPAYEDAPSDWLDLASDPKYKDQYNIFSLGGGTGKTIFSSILVRYADPDGELSISEEGWEVGKNYIQNAHIEIKGEDYIGAVIDGSRPMTMMWGSGVIQNQEERDFKFNIMSPEVGVPYVTEQVAIISKTKKQH